MTTGQQAPAARVDYLDWLRVLAVAGVFVYHAAHPFDTTAWSVKNAEQSKTLLVALGFIGSWGMAFFFVVAGAASYLALRWRSSLRFVRERLVRLLLPLIAAYILLSPLQYVIEQRQLDTPESVLGNIGRFFDGAWQGPPIMVANPYHLWFVVFLLEFSLLGLPLFAWLRGRRGRHVVEWLGDHTEHRGTVLLVILPIALVYIASKRAPGDHGWGEFGYYFGFFLLGHVLMADPRLMRAIRRSLVPALLLAVACAVLLLASGAVDFVAAWWTDRAYSWMYGWIFLLGIVHAWAWITAALNLGLRVPAFQQSLIQISEPTRQ
jgi:glucan biosynthesis protein C